MKLRIKATPNAKNDEIIGWELDPMLGRILKIRISAPPVDGKANTAIRDFIAKQCKLSKSQVVLDKGKTSRVKSFNIPDGTVLPE